jgi:N-acyl amino acid synthase of PEP-CTERM/exosortase system
MSRNDRSPAAIDQGTAPSPTLREAFCEHFESKQARTPEEIDEVFRLRYQVYCVENPFENPAEHLDGRESDEFDAHSAHTLLTHHPTGQAVGAVRLVLPQPAALDRSFPIQQVCGHPLIRDRRAFPLETVGEL